MNKKIEYRWRTVISEETKPQRSHLLRVPTGDDPTTERLCRAGIINYRFSGAPLVNTMRCGRCAHEAREQGISDD